MADLKLYNNNDIDWFNLKLTEDNLESVAQKIKIRLLRYFGEWFLDNTVGVPYFQEILKKGTSKDYIDTLFIDEISNTVGVRRVVSYSSVIDKGVYKASFTAETTENEFFNFNLREIELV